ncbi:hypothetical protein NEDG_00631 [Nematocida displodere]|uniref:Uncharacterized protein n=1 Tax=Nematocida displodere TaxID=1805483 RepID=A0A177ECE8_9MICR|nr:hypothetical protein NEDG_00631 [Nematocida displodere]
MAAENMLYSEEISHPLNPAKDILVFEKHIKRCYDMETRRRIVYFVILTSSIAVFILYVTRQIFTALWDVSLVSPVSISVLMYRIYLKMLGTIVFISYVFLRLLRRSTSITKAMTQQLKLLNIHFRNQKLFLCEIKTPQKIKQSLSIFREEEQKRRVYISKQEKL